MGAHGGCLSTRFLRCSPPGVETRLLFGGGPQRARGLSEMPQNRRGHIDPQNGGISPRFPRKRVDLDLNRPPTGVYYPFSFFLRVSFGLSPLELNFRRIRADAAFALQPKRFESHIPVAHKRLGIYWLSSSMERKFLASDAATGMVCDQDNPH